jgi:DNA-binding transcriptional LysR family regulator
VNAAELPPATSPKPSAGFEGAITIKITWLRSFLAVAQQGGFGAAIPVLHLSQSQVSAHVAALESALGVQVFERSARPTRLTPAGELFRRYAQTALRELEDGVIAARMAGRPDSVRLAVGSYPSVSSAFLPAVLARFREGNPELTVELIEGTASTLEAALTSGAVDVAFRPLLPPLRASGFSHASLWHEEIVAVLPPDDPLARYEAVVVRDLVSRPLIGNPAGGVNEGGAFDLRRVLGETATDADVAYVTDQPATLVALVRSGLGVGVINRLALTTTELGGIEVRPIDSPTAFREVALFWKEQRAAERAINRFVDCARAAPLPPGVAAART